MTQPPMPSPGAPMPPFMPQQMPPPAPSLISASTMRTAIIVLIAVVFLLVVFSLYPGLVAKAIQNTQPTPPPSSLSASVHLVSAPL